MFCLMLTLLLNYDYVDIASVDLLIFLRILKDNPVYFNKDKLDFWKGIMCDFYLHGIGHLMIHTAASLSQVYNIWMLE